MNKRFVIIDGNGLIHRGFHALPPSLRTKDGTLTNGVYGFTVMLLNAWERLRPHYLAVSFDLAAPTFRHELYDGYKAHREKAPDELYAQIPLVRKVVEAFSIPIVEKKGYEADDVIGTTVKQVTASSDKIEAIIVTGDLDALQLVGDQVKVFTLKKGFRETMLYDRIAVEQKIGLPPETVIDYKAIAGDTSDNIPGVKGIGPKGAVELLKKFKTLDRIYEELERKNNKIPPRYQDKLTLQKKNAYLSQKLASIDLKVPISLKLEDCRVEDFDRGKVARLFEQLEFRSLIRRIPSSAPRLSEDGAALMPAYRKEGYQTVFKPAELEKLVDEIKRERLVAIDTETSSLDENRTDLVGISFCCQPGKAYYLPLSHRHEACTPLTNPEEAQNNLSAVAAQMSFDQARKILNPIFSDPRIAKLGHNLKFDICVLVRAGFKELAGVSFDTMIASYVLDPGGRDHSLATLAAAELGLAKVPLQNFIGRGAKQISFATVPIDQAAFYSGQDADLTRQLYEALRRKLTAETRQQAGKHFPGTEKDLQYIFEYLEMPLVAVLIRMQQTGILLDLSVVRSARRSLAQRIERLERLIYEGAGERFNVNSPQQLSKILFEKLRLPTETVKKLTSGYSTAADELEKLRSEHEIVSRILAYRETAKLLNTYVDVLPELVHEDGRIHTSFNQVVTATGRLSSSDPNMQNIPIRTEEGREVRKAFVAPPGKLLYSLDYSQIDLRVLAHYSQDRLLLEAFAGGKDIHRATAAKIFEITESQVLPEMRRIAKVVNFGVIYGMSPYGLAQTLGIARERADRYIKAYFAQHSGVTAYINKVKEFVRANGYVETVLGRRRYIHDLDAKNFALRAAAERMAINMPIQGTAADIIKLAMVQIDEQLQKDEWKEIKLLLQVHDELLFEAPRDLGKKFITVAKKIMEESYHLKVPIVVELKTGSSWGEMQS